MFVDLSDTADQNITSNIPSHIYVCGVFLFFFHPVCLRLLISDVKQVFRLDSASQPCDMISEQSPWMEIYSVPIRDSG